MASPLMSLGSGFLRAVFAAFDTRGAPWIMRGSFMRLVSNLAGARGDNISTCAPDTRGEDRRKTNLG